MLKAKPSYWNATKGIGLSKDHRTFTLHGHHPISTHPASQSYFLSENTGSQNIKCGEAVTHRQAGTRYHSNLKGN